MKTRAPLSGHAKAWLVIGMAWVAGYVDIVGWLTFSHVYISHMTGNTASFAQAAAIQSWRSAIKHGWPIVPFIGGLFYGASVSKIAKRSGFHHAVSLGFVTELALLAAVLAVAKKDYWMSALLAAAMGIQTVTITRVKGLRVYSTYVTGTLSKFAEAVVDFGFWFYDRTRGRFWSRLIKALRVSPRQSALQHAVLTWALWTGFLLGAVCGTLMDARFGLRALTVPMAALAVGIFVDLGRPVTAANEAIERWSAH